MATSDELEMLRELEQEMGIETRSGPGFTGAAHVTIQPDSEVREAKASGAPRIMLKTLVDYPEEYAGRKPTAFLGWFGNTPEGSKTSRNITFDQLKCIAAQGENLDVKGLVDAMRNLPAEHGAEHYEAAFNAMTHIVEALKGAGAWVEVYTTRVKIEEDGKTTGGEVRVGILHPESKKVKALQELANATI